jgi:L-ascorbate metabolism protein UlaG (beta-lactamase superfamily)
VFSRSLPVTFAGSRLADGGNAEQCLFRVSSRPVAKRRFMRPFVYSLLALLVVVAVGGSIAGCLFSAPSYRGPRSDHFDGEKFHNQSESARQAEGFGRLLKWQLSREQGPWREFQPAPPGAAPPRRVGHGQLRVTFINHATTLIQLDDVNILTDPIWSERCSPVGWAGPRRVRPPGIRFEDLPAIDAVVISHNHYDHLDVPTLRRLAQAHKPVILAGLGNAALLKKEGVTGAVDLDWWQSTGLTAGVRVTMAPSQHFSGRGLTDRDETLWASYVISAPGGNVYFAGDTGMGPHFQQIAARFSPIRLAILPIGAFRPEWFMSRVHITPEEAIAAHHILRAGTSLGMHFGTFRLADDAQDEPTERIRAAVEKSGPAPENQPRFWVLGFGEGRDVP